MALNQTMKISLTMSSLGALSFIFGVVAENKKHPYGTPIIGQGVVICKFASDPTIALGSFSVVMLFLAVIVGHVAVYFPYKGKSVPQQALFSSTSLVVFVVIAEILSALAMGMMMWATITEGLNRVHNIHHDLKTQCPTAKTGVFGGAAFLSLDAVLIWLVCQMLTLNARADYLGENDPEGEYGLVYAADYNAKGADPPLSMA